MRPNKFLGQNFLSSKKIVEEIIHAADIRPNDVVLEVGPGKGILTEALLGARAKVVAVEKDKRLFDYLKEKFANVKNLEIIHADILKFNFTRYSLPVTRYKIVANIPYYITSRFLRTFLQSDFQPSKMVLMVQKEVAKRIVSPKESILSISIKTYGQPKIIRTVPAQYFSPKPKVDSAILLVDKISKEFFRDAAKLTSLITGTKGNDTEAKLRGSLEAKFFGLVKKGFSSKRKMLKNNLGLSNTECLTKCGISEKARAEDLSPKNWECLYKNLYNLI